MTLARLPFCVLLLPAASGVQKPPLRLQLDGSFSIMQVADVHTGEGEASWGPGVDLRTYVALDQALAHEQPDLAVFSGDMLTGLNVDANATAYWDLLTSVFDKRGVPHTAILGNHDAEPFSASGANQSSPGAKTTRTQLMQHDAALPLSHSQVGPPTLAPAVSVYVVDVLEEEGQQPALSLVHLDSGGGGMPEELYSNQILWFNQTIAARRHRHRGAIVPALVFVHIPLWEYSTALSQGKCFGTSDDGITPTISNTGLFKALEAAPEVEAVFVGHDHCNDWCCEFGERAVDLCFGRHSGWGGYDCDEPSGSAHKYAKGSRMITFQRQRGMAATAGHTITTHVRLANGSVIHFGRLV